MRDRDTSLGGGGITMLAVGLLAGLAAGGYLAHRLGGVTGITGRIRRLLPHPSRRPRTRMAPAADEDDEEAFDSSFNTDYDEDHQTMMEADGEDDRGESDEEELVAESPGGEGADGDDHYDDDLDDDDFDEDEDEEDDDDLAAVGADEDFASADPDLEDRVLEAFVNDPVLRERAVDIGAIDPGTIELTGAVRVEVERERATTIAGGVPGVRSVVNHLSVIHADEETPRPLAEDRAEGDAEVDEIAEHRRRRAPARDRSVGTRGGASGEVPTSDSPANRQPPLG